MFSIYLPKNSIITFSINVLFYSALGFLLSVIITENGIHDRALFVYPILLVAAASEEQSSASEQIGKNIELINQVTQETAGGIQQIAHASEDLNRLTLNLQELITQFKLEEKYAVRTNGKLIHI